MASGWWLVVSVRTPENVTLLPFFTRFRLSGWVAVSFVVSNTIGTGTYPASAAANAAPLTEPRPVTMS